MAHGDPFGPGSIRVAIEAATGVFALRVTIPVARHSRACLRIEFFQKNGAPRRRANAPQPDAPELQERRYARHLWA